MLKKLLAFVALAGLLTAGLPTAQAGPSAGGLSSDNVEFVTHIPFEVGTATGARVIGKYLYVTSWKSFSIYDVSDPLAPIRVSTTPFGFQFENEDVATNGKIMLFSESLPRSVLHIWDVEDKTNPVEVATLSGAGQHTMSCILRCTYGYGSDGAIVDLRDPTKPKLVGDWGKGPGVQTSSGHDVEEVKNGFVLTDTQPIQLLDARNPLKPKLLALGASEDGRFIHSIRWPRQMKDQIFLAGGETNANTRCKDRSGAFMSWSAKDWKKTGTFRMMDEFRAQNGTFTDGSPPVNGLGCSSHWFQEHPTFNNGGLVAVGFYEHGTRFIDVAEGSGKLKEVGYFLPYSGSTSAAYWLTDKIVYAVDYTRGIDVLKYNGKV